MPDDEASVANASAIITKDMLQASSGSSSNAQASRSPTQVPTIRCTCRFQTARSEAPWITAAQLTGPNRHARPAAPAAIAIDAPTNTPMRMES